jgi:hypothetical protein
MRTHGSENSNGLGAAAKQVAEHASALARLEVELASLELKRKVAALGIGIALAAVGGIFALFGFGFGLAAAAAALGNVVATWLALLIVFGALLLLGALLALIGLGRIRKGTPPVPDEAIDEAKKTTEALRANGGA